MASFNFLERRSPIKPIMPTPRPRRTARDVLTPESLRLLAEIARLGGLAQAARANGLAPSALSHRLRGIEDALDVLLFDRRAKRLQPTPAGAELLREGTQMLAALDTLAQRVRRVASGWEAQFTIAVDAIIVKSTVLELCERLLQTDCPTQLRLRDETLSGTLEALTSGAADLALGVAEGLPPDGLNSLALGEVEFVFAVAPHHPLARGSSPLGDAQIAPHRVVAVADSATRGRGLSIGLQSGQAVFTVATMRDKLDAQLRGLGCGWLPRPLAQAFLTSGRLVARPTEQPPRVVGVHALWRAAPAAQMGATLRWWVAALQAPATRSALLQRAGVTA